jgi:hypothetical protein
MFTNVSVSNAKILISASAQARVPTWKKAIKSPGGVAQWTSHPPQEREEPGSNPARV